MWISLFIINFRIRTRLLVFSRHSSLISHFLQFTNDSHHSWNGPEVGIAVRCYHLAEIILPLDRPTPVSYQCSVGNLRPFVAIYKLHTRMCCLNPQDILLDNILCREIWTVQRLSARHSRQINTIWSFRLGHISSSFNSYLKINSPFLTAYANYANLISQKSI